MKARLFLSLWGILFSHNLVASESNGKVIDYWIHNTHDSFAFSVESQTGRPSCATFGNPSGRYVVDTRTQAGKLIVSAVMAAKASGANIQVGGKGKCDYYSDSEDLQFLRAY
ncbi:hypothetical protein [Vibrio caribbeanicus]|uniref:Uncharacterized protein n=1 Tax=Vibrio caribbeanicus ATCC BAA-2122 TaxID=796620 RepID=E3BHL9_9VIBR|nr:hypothetical protein [Vibrio caribbeanicus]EFP97308.1 hypothetical protein VIBC2010_17974 [Vibrio caribbeanicus ATCC BAA-2122]